MLENDNENKVIFTPDVEEEGRIDEFPTINPKDLQNPRLATLPVDTAELEAEEKIMEGVENAVEDLDKRNYLKVSPTFYIQAVKSENEEDEQFKILNPVTGVVETRELTDDEKKELFVRQLKESRKTFNPLSHPTKVVRTSTLSSPVIEKRKRVVKEREAVTNVTKNKFGAAYRKKRQNRNKLAKASRKANR